MTAFFDTVQIVLPPESSELSAWLLCPLSYRRRTILQHVPFHPPGLPLADLAVTTQHNEANTQTLHDTVSRDSTRSG